MNSLYVQVMGNTYGSILVPTNATRNETERIARSPKHVRRMLQNKIISKTIITDKIVNFIVKEKEEEKNEK